MKRLICVTVLFKAHCLFSALMKLGRLQIGAKSCGFICVFHKRIGFGCANFNCSCHEVVICFNLKMFNAEK